MINVVPNVASIGKLSSVCYFKVASGKILLI